MFKKLRIGYTMCGLNREDANLFIMAARMNGVKPKQITTRLSDDYETYIVDLNGITTKQSNAIRDLYIAGQNYIPA